MPRIAYREINLSDKSLALIEVANTIIEEFSAQGFDLTLRQLYYQFVARDVIPNTERSYKSLGEVISNARLAGYIDWLAIEDRTRNLRSVSHWESPAEIVKAVSEQYRRDKWEGQDNYVEVWVEKDALAGVVGRIATALDVPYFACRGYVSQSEMWVASQRLVRAAEDGRQPVIVHLGDHDPSGIDMTRDIEDRLTMFLDRDGFEAPTVNRIALNMDQVRRYSPPPNPAKVTDSRATSYIKRFGQSSWELDALNPTVLADLIRTEVESHLDIGMWNERRARERREQAQLAAVSEKWAHVPAMVRGRGALTLLRELEYAGTVHGKAVCPSCKSRYDQVHTPGCELNLIVNERNEELD